MFFQFLVALFYFIIHVNFPDIILNSSMDENKVDPMYMENLDEWILEENKVVTYKYLSRSLKVHVNVAKQMLFNFAETKKSSSTPLLGIVYLVLGMVE